MKDEDGVEPEVVRVGLPAALVCPKSGPPASWFSTYKLYTPGCSACPNL